MFDRKTVQLMDIWMLVTAIYFHNNLSSAIPLLLLGGSFLLTVNRERNWNEGLLIAGTIALFLDVGYQGHQFEWIMTAIGLVAANIIGSKKLDIFRSIKNAVVMHEFIKSKKYDMLYCWVSKRLSFTNAPFDKDLIKWIAGYKGKEIIIFNKRFIKPKKRPAPNIIYLDSDQFIEVIKKNPQTKDDVVLAVI